MGFHSWWKFSKEEESRENWKIARRIYWQLEEFFNWNLLPKKWEMKGSLFSEQKYGSKTRASSTGNGSQSPNCSKKWFDNSSVVADFEVFFTEDSIDLISRNWTRLKPTTTQTTSNELFTKPLERPLMVHRNCSKCPSSISQWGTKNVRLSILIQKTLPWGS